jgi:hypothetical protein
VYLDGDECDRLLEFSGVIFYSLVLLCIPTGRARWCRTASAVGAATRFVRAHRLVHVVRR